MYSCDVTILCILLLRVRSILFICNSYNVACFCQFINGTLSIIHVYSTGFFPLPHSIFCVSWFWFIHQVLHGVIFNVFLAQSGVDGRSNDIIMILEESIMDTVTGCIL